MAIRDARMRRGRRSAPRATDSKRGVLIGLVAALLVGFNLRPAITSVSALLSETTAHFGLNSVESTALVTLPVIVFGVTAPLGPWLARRIGVSRALLWIMVALAVMLAVRVVAPWLMLAGTVVAGAAIMAAGTVLPQFLKSVNASGVWVGLSSMSFGVGAALGAALVVPFHQSSGSSVPIALGLWAALPMVAAVVLAVASRRAGKPTEQLERTKLVVPRGGLRTIVLITVVFGLQAMLYFAITSWVPLFLADQGEPAATRGWLLAWFSIAGFVPTFLTPVLARNTRILRWLGPSLGIAFALGVGWLSVASSAQYFWVVGLLGATQSAAFGLTISLIIGLSANATSAGAVSAVGQGIGYIVAGAGSLLIGVAHTASGAWPWSFAMMAACALLLSVATIVLIRRPPVDLVAPHPQPQPEPHPQTMPVASPSGT